MGRERNKKKNRRKLLNQNGVAIDEKGQATASPKVPQPFQNLLLRPMNCIVNLRGKDPKQPLSDGQMLVTIDRYAVIPLEQYNDLLRVAKTKGARAVPATAGRQQPLVTRIPGPRIRKEANDGNTEPTGEDSK